MASWKGGPRRPCPGPEVISNRVLSKDTLSCGCDKTRDCCRTRDVENSRARASPKPPHKPLSVFPHRSKCPSCLVVQRPHAVRARGPTLFRPPPAVNDIRNGFLGGL